jgi:hypothetical protein
MRCYKASNISTIFAITDELCIKSAFHTQKVAFCRWIVLKFDYTDED